MTNPATPPPDDFLARLVALDEALADGGAVEDDPAADARWRESAAVLELLHRANPRRPAAAHPARVGRFVIEGVLGSGASGVVYAATDPSVGRRVAVKVLTQADAVSLARFRVEVAALAALNHPHVVQVFEVGEHEGRPFLVMELVPGGSLADHAPRADNPERYAARLVSQIARGVGAAHAAGILHRDLKPRNILVAPGGVPKVADFGLARRLDRADPLTVPGTSIGSPNYMSPEQAAGRVDEVGVASDVYGLGAVLFSLLTGRPPFVGVIGFDLLRQIVIDAPPRPNDLNRAVPPELEAICLRCLAKNPAGRYPSADALADDLDAFLSGTGVRALTPSARRGRQLVTWLLGLVVLAAVVWGVGRARPGVTPAVAPAPVAVRVGDVVGRHEGLYSLSLSPDGRRAASVAITVKGLVWDVADRRVVAELPRTDHSTPVAFFPDGDRLVGVFPTNRLGVWSVSQGRFVAERQLPENVNAVAVRADDELVAATDREGVTHLWRPSTGEARATRRAGLRYAGVGVVFRPGHDEIFTARQFSESLDVWTFGGDEVRVVPNVGATMPQHLTALPDGRAVVSNGRRLFVVSPTEPPRVRTLPVDDGVGVRSMAVTNEGRWVVCACQDGTTRVWDVESGAELARGATPGVRLVATTAAGTRGVIGYADGTICEFRLSGGN